MKKDRPLAWIQGEGNRERIYSSRVRDLAVNPSGRLSHMLRKEIEARGWGGGWGGYDGK